MSTDADAPKSTVMKKGDIIQFAASTERKF